MDSTLLVKVIVTSVRAKPQGCNSIMQNICILHMQLFNMNNSCCCLSSGLQIRYSNSFHIVTLSFLICGSKVYPGKASTFHLVIGKINGKMCGKFRVSRPGNGGHYLYLILLIKTQIMASGPITSWQTDGETVADFIFLGFKITADGDCNHEIKRHSLEGKL